MICYIYFLNNYIGMVFCIDFFVLRELFFFLVFEFDLGRIIVVLVSFKKYNNKCKLGILIIIFLVKFI